MKAIVTLWIVIFLGGWATPVLASSCGANISVVVSERIKQKTTTAEARDMLCAVGAQLALDPGQTNIILLQVSPEEAAVAHVTATESIREVRTLGHPMSVYLVWLIGDNNRQQLANLLGSTLADSAGVRPSTEQFRAAVHRAVIQEDATVAKNALLPRKH
jgi:hypothetical protein